MCIWSEYRRVQNIGLSTMGTPSQRLPYLNIKKPIKRQEIFVLNACHIMKTLNWVKQALKKYSPVLLTEVKQEQLDLCACSLRESLHVGIIT